MSGGSRGAAESMLTRQPIRGRSRTMAKKPSRTSSPAGGAAAEDSSEPDGGAADLSYSESRAALELVLAELQSSDLDVEAMTGLYRRGLAYARRCREILDQVEQEVMVWDPLSDPDASPQPCGPHLPSD